MAANLHSQPNLEATSQSLAFAKEAAESSTEIQAASRQLAEALSYQELNFYQNLVQETASKSKSAIRTGFIIFLSGALMASFIPQLTARAHEFSLAYLFSLREFWITLGTFSLIGIYSMWQGRVGKKQSLIHLAILGSALKLKKEAN